MIKDKKYLLERLSEVLDDNRCNSCPVCGGDLQMFCITALQCSDDCGYVKSLGAFLEEKLPIKEQRLGFDWNVSMESCRC